VRQTKLRCPREILRTTTLDFLQVDTLVKVGKHCLCMVVMPGRSSHAGDFAGITGIKSCNHIAGFNILDLEQITSALALVPPGADRQHLTVADVEGGTGAFALLDHKLTKLLMQVRAP